MDRLVSTASVEEQWSAVVGPWLREHAASAWKSARPTVVLTPSRAESFYLRGRLVGQGVPFLGLRFWTPSDARKFLLGELSPGVAAATQAELRLLARVCAENVALQTRDDSATLASVAREPTAFLRAYDLLLGAGWDPVEAGAPYGRALSRAMRDELDALRVATQAGIHRIILREASNRKPGLIASLLVIGFNASHWPLWDLLQATVAAAENSVVVLSNPRSFGEAPDRLWIGSWEERVGEEATPAPAVGDEAPFAPLVDSYEQGAKAEAGDADLTLLVTPDVTSQIRAVVLQALDYLKRESCTRLGIVFPEANAVALGVADELRRLDIPLDDGVGSLAPGLFERRCWSTWLALQEEPGVPQLIAWLRACEAQGVSCGIDSPMPAREIADVLENALGDTLVDDLGVLARHLENSRRASDGLVADFLLERVVLPPEETFATFLALTRQALAAPGWEKHLARLEVDPPAWLQRYPEEFSRRIFLEWLKEVTHSKTRTRGAEGNHFYGRVHLLAYGQLGGQTWSHLILTGMNEGVWPRVFEPGAFGSRHELEALNRRARDLNRRGIAQGGQGEGHETVVAGHGHCLLPLERQELALRDVCAALESTREAACLTAMTTAEGRSLLPSDFFGHAFQAATGRTLDEESFRALALHTEAWCRDHEPLFHDNASNGIAEERDARAARIAATRVAHDARRNPAQPFGPYEFAYTQPPAEPVQLACKEWERAWNHPASVWLEHIVGARPWPEGKLSWPRAVGTWTHRWLSAALRESDKHHPASELPARLGSTAGREADRVRELARAAGIDLYPWWEQVWSQARTMALALAESLTPHLQDRPFLTEMKLRGEMIALPGASQADFMLRGRIDLVLFEAGSAPPDIGAKEFPGRECWIVDFKTGSADALTVRKIEQGKGLQPLLYGLAMRAGGATSTAISVLNPGAPLEPQVQVEETLGLATLFRSLDKLHRDGVFGMRPGAVSAYGYSPEFPMATRFVPGDVLTAKWALTHGTAPAAEEEAS